MKFKRISTVHLRKRLADVINEIFYTDTVYVVTRRDKPFILLSRPDDGMELIDKTIDD